MIHLFPGGKISMKLSSQRVKQRAELSFFTPFSQFRKVKGHDFHSSIPIKVYVSVCSYL